MHFKHGLIGIAAITGVLSIALPEPTSGPHELCLARDSPCGVSSHEGHNMPCCNELECVFTFDDPIYIYLCLPPPPGWTTPSVTPVLPAKSTRTRTSTRTSTRTYTSKATMYPRNGENWGCDNSHCVPPHAHPERDIDSSSSLNERGCGCTGHGQLDKRGGENWGCNDCQCVPPHAHPERDIESSVSLSECHCGCTGSSKRSDTN